MKRRLLAVLVATGLSLFGETAPSDPVTQADLRLLLERLAKLEAENQTQAARIAELEARVKANGEVSVDVLRTEKRETLAETAAPLLDPFSDAGLRVTPYGSIVLEGVYSNHGLDTDWATDFVKPKTNRGYRNHNSILSCQDTILGFRLLTPEVNHGWVVSGNFEMDFAGDDADDYAFHLRHLYISAAHETGWSVLFGQTWHLWKIVSPSGLDGAWMENTGHPYRRSPQFRVTKKWEWEESSLEARIGYLKNGPGASTDRDGDGTLDSTSSAWGWIEGALVYDHVAPWQENGRRWLVGLGGMYGRDRSRRLSGYDADGNAFYEGKNDDYNSQMILLAAAVPVGDFMLSGQVFGGENLGRVQAGCAQSVAFDGLLNTKGHEIVTVGGFLDLTYKLNAEWDFALGYGFDDPRISARYPIGASNRGISFNDRAYIDAFYHITENFKLGLEYARLSTKYDGIGTSMASRFQFTAFYDF